MLRSLRSLRGYAIQALDGKLGDVHEFYFDDREWIVRYLVVDTGNWLTGRRVLLSPAALGQPDHESETLAANLTMEQVESSPPISTEKPVSRQMEAELHAYYQWAPYWGAATPMINVYNPMPVQTLAVKEAEEEAEQEAGDPHLRSTREVDGYHIEARDDEIGHVEDFIADTESWDIRYLVVNTHNWLPGRKVLVSPAWVQEVDWVARVVSVDLSRDTIAESPEYDPSAPVNRAYEGQLYDYYGRPRYWDREEDA
jgi:uncharacterized protein YrrD